MSNEPTFFDQDSTAAQNERLTFGIGFDQKCALHIFQVFQRLHDKSQYAGTSIGLAICEKVVANHGGAVTASSTPGQGAAFSVYLPAKTEAVNR